jgi:hypothetical protein
VNSFGFSVFSATDSNFDNNSAAVVTNSIFCRSFKPVLDYQSELWFVYVCVFGLCVCLCVYVWIVCVIVCV